MRRKRRTDVDLTMSPEDRFQLLRRRSRRLGRRQCRRQRRYRAVSYQSLESRRRAQHKHSRGVAVHTEGVRDASRHHSRRARRELKPMFARLHGQHSFPHDVTLVLRMCVKWWRCVAWKEEFDQREAPVARLARQLDRCQGAKEPELLTLPRTRPSRRPAHSLTIPWATGLGFARQTGERESRVLRCRRGLGEARG